MSEEVITVEMNTSLTEAFRLMKENNIRRLPVMDKGRL
ncbi:MAG: CBS domain-containing protein, partial [Syntrophomonas sp.]|nr:CBS domain-containing protein [Syntrophomonas sp.]